MWCNAHFIVLFVVYRRVVKTTGNINKLDELSDD